MTDQNGEAGKSRHGLGESDEGPDCALHRLRVGAEGWGSVGHAHLRPPASFSALGALGITVPSFPVIPAPT